MLTNYTVSNTTQSTTTSGPVTTASSATTGAPVTTTVAGKYCWRSFSLNDITVESKWHMTQKKRAPPHANWGEDDQMGDEHLAQDEKQMRRCDSWLALMALKRRWEMLVFGDVVTSIKQAEHYLRTQQICQSLGVGRGRPARRWKHSRKKDLELWGLKEEYMRDEANWWRLLHRADADRQWQWKTNITKVPWYISFTTDVIKPSVIKMCIILFVQHVYQLSVC